MAWHWSTSVPFPFKLAANDLGVVITYAPASGHYLGQIACSDIAVRQGKAAVVHSKLDLSVDLSPDTVDVKTLHFSTPSTRLLVSGNLSHFAHPQWQGSREWHGRAGGTDRHGPGRRLPARYVELALGGKGTGANQYVLDGKAKVVNASYAMEYFWIDGVNATTRVHITPDEITLPDLVARPRQGGIVEGGSSLSALERAVRPSQSRCSADVEHPRPGARHPPEHRARQRRPQPLSGSRLRYRRGRNRQCRLDRGAG